MLTMDMQVVRDRLQPASDMLGADGYSIEILETSEALDLTIVAGPSACAECLVPHDLLASMLAHLLDPEGAGTPTIRLHYPPAKVGH